MQNYTKFGHFILRKIIENCYYYNYYYYYKWKD